MNDVPPPSVLLVEDEARYRQVLRKELERRGLEVREASTGLEGLERLNESPADVIVLDLKMAGMGGIEFLCQHRERGGEAEVIVLTGHASLDTAVEALRQGAYDYFSKPVDLDILERTILRAGEHHRLAEENRALRRALTPVRGAPAIASSSPPMRDLLARLPRLAASDATVLVTGETGTGKEVLAREIHRLSGRSTEPLVVIDCGALQGSVRGSELFGHERGAFTGASHTRPGLFEAADGGTVFLDEIGELDAESQASLLRVLENSEIRRLGATRARTIDVRVIVATNRNLVEEVEARRFREDLLYRLQVVQLHLPPLRDRSEDLDELFQSFLARHCPGRVPPRLSAGAQKVMRSHHWPGNIRELRNLAEMIGVIVEGDQVDASDLPPHMLQSGGAPRPRSQQSVAPLRELEQRHILHVFELCEGNKKQAAQLLGISLRTLYNKLADYESPTVPSPISGQPG